MSTNLNENKRYNFDAISSKICLKQEVNAYIMRKERNDKAQKS